MLLFIIKNLSTKTKEIISYSALGQSLLAFPKITEYGQEQHRPEVAKLLASLGHIGRRIILAYTYELKKKEQQEKSHSVLRFRVGLHSNTSGLQVGHAWHRPSQLQLFGKFPRLFRKDIAYLLRRKGQCLILNYLTSTHIIFKTLISEIPDRV